MHEGALVIKGLEKINQISYKSCAQKRTLYSNADVHGEQRERRSEKKDINDGKYSRHVSLA
jgi:hypothetical protein